MRVCLLMLLLLRLAAATAPVLAHQVVIDGDGDDRWYAVAPTTTGAVVAGRLATAPDGPVVGMAADGWTYGYGIMALIDAAGGITARSVFADGLFLPTAVTATADAVFVGGYAAPPMVGLIADLGGLQREASWAQRDWKTWCPPEHHSEPLRKDATDQRGVPCVLRFSADLTTLEGGTFLEGWQSAWHIPEPLREDTYQPLLLAIAADGDVIVAHDGGYCLPPKEGEAPSFEHFYAVGDHLSRLAPDLKQRRWHTVFHTPKTARAKVLKYQDKSGHFTMKWGSPKLEQWDHDFLGQPRTLRMRLDAQDRIYGAGWSPTRTSGEPWWSPFCLRFDPATGAEDEWRIYTPDPMGGGDDRMGGEVSDACIRSLALTADDRLLLSLTGDGGNNVLTRDPVDDTKGVAMQGRVGPFSGRHLFWGGWSMVDPVDRAFVMGHYVGRLVSRPRRRGQPPKLLQQDMWIVDLADTPDGGVVATGRFKDGLVTTDDAWHDGQELKAGGFLQCYDGTGACTFATALPDVRPFELRRSVNRVWIVGERWAPADQGTAAVCLAVDLPE